MRDLLDEAAQRQGVVLADEARDRLAAWADLLLRHNGRANLIGPMNAARVADEIVVDSLQALRYLPPAARVVDVGSGAGVPGTPLALAGDVEHVTWVEPRARRAMFLQTAKRSLGLSGTVVEGRIEALQPGARFDVAVSRAVFAPGEWLTVGRDLVRPQGVVVVWCNGAPDEARAELGTVEGLTELGVHAYELADGRVRSVLGFVTPGPA